MDSELLKKNGKTICWKKLNPSDLEEVIRLVEGPYSNEPMLMAQGDSHSLKRTSEIGKVFNLLMVLACLNKK